LQTGTLLGLVFIHWLFYQSVYSIHALCPYCMVVWAMTIALFWYTLLYNLRHGYIKPPKTWSKAVAFAQRHHLDVVIVWYLVIAGLILNHFWYYFGPK
jgi:vitamin K epoxide reductase family protein